jgi:hypothetical protein
VRIVSSDDRHAGAGGARRVALEAETRAGGVAADAVGAMSAQAVGVGVARAAVPSHAEPIGHSPGGSEPAGNGRQVPSAPGRSQAWQVPVQAALQQ